MIKGIEVTLYEKRPVGKNGFDKTIFEEIPTIVENVLIEPMSEDDIVNTETLYGKKAVYRICIPKGDAHKWEDSKVVFFDKEWKVFGLPLEYIEGLLPLAWNKKYTVERYG